MLVLRGAARRVQRQALARAARPFRPGVTVPRSRARALEGAPGEASGAVRERVAAARERSRDDAPRRSEAATALLGRAVERLPLSGRGRARVARVAQTVALLAG